MNYKKIFK